MLFLPLSAFAIKRYFKKNKNKCKEGTQESTYKLRKLITSIFFLISLSLKWAFSSVFTGGKSHLFFIINFDSSLIVI